VAHFPAAPPHLQQDSAPLIDVTHPQDRHRFRMTWLIQIAPTRGEGRLEGI
jgi:hypothetical protein